VKVVRRGNTAALQRALDAAAKDAASFPGDPDGPPPPGYRMDEYRRRIGDTDEVFERAARAIAGWQVQRGSGLVAYTTAEQVHEGAEVVVGLPAGPVLVLAPCRVDRVYDSPTKAGFRYVTLPGHPERGHEEFVVERDATGEISFVVRPVSRPASLFTWLGLPVARLAQRKASNRYLDAIDGLSR
jgi:uncharacterized protein (UPF0548 family)